MSEDATAMSISKALWTLNVLEIIEIREITVARTTDTEKLPDLLNPTLSVGEV
jgi:hypothetical protein